MSITIFNTYARKLRSWLHAGDAHERTLELIGKFLANEVASNRTITSLHDAEFRVFSQWGDDGAIQWLVANISPLEKTFIEFGVEDYSESNTRFLMVNNNWRGLVLDGSRANIAHLRKRKWFWRHDLTAIQRFVTRDNVNSIISEWAGDSAIGILHIDVDGNDYWLWEAIENVPAIVIMEFNALFGSERTITIPYLAEFERFRAHYSGQYFGASLAAMAHLANRRGYALVGVNSAGNNAYFVQRHLMSGPIQEVSVKQAFVMPTARESRDRGGRLDFLSYAQRCSLIRGMPVLNLLTEKVEPF